MPLSRIAIAPLYSKWAIRPSVFATGSDVSVKIAMYRRHKKGIVTAGQSKNTIFTPICQGKPDFDTYNFGIFIVFTKKLRRFHQKQ
jgi:hypothetical protein